MTIMTKFGVLTTAFTLAAAMGSAQVPTGSEGFPTDRTPKPTLAFVKVSPCRAIDTRGAGESEASPISEGKPRNFRLLGSCGIPANAEAVSANMIVTETTDSGSLMASPTGSQSTTPRGPVVVYDSKDQTAANGAIITLGTDGWFTASVYGGSTHLLLDVNGYYVPQVAVSSLNGLSGDVNLMAGRNIELVPGRTGILINSTVEQGPAGPQGEVGPAGPQGEEGPAGPQGEVGPTGPQGETGAAGPQGEVGPAGPQGVAGPAGPAGATGATGAQGPAANLAGPYRIRSVTTSTTLNGLSAGAPDQFVLVTPATGSVTLTLPSAASNTGQLITVKNVSNTNTFVLTPIVATDGGPNLVVSLAGTASNSPSSGSLVTAISNGTSWFVLNTH
jgi:hypothetical protein